MAYCVICKQEHLSENDHSHHWRPFYEAPKDGSVFWIREDGWHPSKAFYKDGCLKHIDFQHTNRPTHWSPSAKVTG